jgi:hypothetical protein
MPNANTAMAYRDGYAEGRRTALHLVVPLEDSIVYDTAGRECSNRDAWPIVRGYWLGFRRAMRLHYADAYRPTVLDARRRRGC